MHSVLGKRGTRGEGKGSPFIKKSSPLLFSADSLVEADALRQLDEWRGLARPEGEVGVSVEDNVSGLVCVERSGSRLGEVDHSTLMRT